jgi:uncharacterized NAD-dependent epimerase/dehydratase family protein
VSQPTVLDGPAIVWCDGAFNTPEGKTAHGLVRFTHRYRVLSVIDRKHAGRDALDVLDGRTAGIPVVPDLTAALAEARARGVTPTHFVIGLAPDGGRLPAAGRAVVLEALQAGLNVDCGLHDFLSEDPVLAEAAATSGARIRDVRRPPHRRDLHSFSGRIEEVKSLKVALLGTDSAVGKRTTAWMVVQEVQRRGRTAELVGTGQTAWLQGAKFSLVLDSLVNDFLAGELEHAVVRAWDEAKPEVIVVEGQGSLMNPAYPGGMEILAACRPEVVVMQHAPTRLEYDGFPGYPIHPIEHQIKAIEILSSRPVLAITVNHEGLHTREAIDRACAELHERTGLPVCDPLVHGVGAVVDALDAWKRDHA